MIVRHIWQGQLNQSIQCCNLSCSTMKNDNLTAVSIDKKHGKRHCDHVSHLLFSVNSSSEIIYCTRVLGVKLSALSVTEAFFSCVMKMSGRQVLQKGQNSKIIIPGSLVERVMFCCALFIQMSICFLWWKLLSEFWQCYFTFYSQLCMNIKWF